VRRVQRCVKNQTIWLQVTAWHKQSEQEAKH